VYSTVETTHQALGSAATTLPPAAPLHFLARDIERLALSTCLTRLELVLPARVGDADDAPTLRQFAAAAAVLPRCPVLRELHLFVASAPPAHATLHADLTAVLPRCASLSALCLIGYERPGGRRLRLETASLVRLCGALPALPGVTSLEITGVETEHNSEVLFRALERHTTLQELCLFGVKTTPGWWRFVALQHLQVIKIEVCPGWPGMASPLDEVPLGDALTQVWGVGMGREG